MRFALHASLKWNNSIVIEQIFYCCFSMFVLLNQVLVCDVSSTQYFQIRFIRTKTVFSSQASFNSLSQSIPRLSLWIRWDSISVWVSGSLLTFDSWTLRDFLEFCYKFGCTTSNIKKLRIGNDKKKYQLVKLEETKMFDCFPKEPVQNSSK